MKNALITCAVGVVLLSACGEDVPDRVANDPNDPVQQLREIVEREAEHALQIVGAVYELESGRVRVLE
jgi:hypothetical protein